MKLERIDHIKPAWLIARREISDQFRDWRIVIPIVGLTVFFPFLMNFTAERILQFVEEYGATIIGERLVPFLLMIVGFFPISMSLIIALESFVGEKERLSIEPLLNTPLQDWQLYTGKLFSSLVVPLLSSYLGMGVYVLGLLVKGITIPEIELLILIFVLTTVQAVMMVSGAVVVSSHATSVRAANLLASMIIIPSALLIQGESVVMFWGDYWALWIVVFGLGVLSLLLLRVGLAHFKREELLGREIDALNIKWGWKIFRDRFWGCSHGVISWYRGEVFPTLKELRIPIVLVTVLGIAGIFVGSSQVQKFYVDLGDLSIIEINNKVKIINEILPLFDLRPVLMILWQNSRVLLLSMILGVFSLGIFGMLPFIISMAVIGYLFTLMQLNHFPMLVYVLLVIPHGIIEIPAAIISIAAVLKIGAVMSTPSSNKTIAEVLIESLADWVKITLAISLPLIVIAAFIEAWITPRVALLLLS